MISPVLFRRILWLIIGCIICGLAFVFPPFHIVALDTARDTAQSQVFNPRQFASDFWQKKLGQSFENAFEAGVVLDAIGLDRELAKQRYGLVVGLDGPHHYFLKGTGRIVAINDRQVELSLTGNDTGKADIVILISMIFGNEILNATNMVSRSQFRRTNDFNSVSAEINKIVETQIVPPFLGKAKIGSIVDFVGCSSKISDDDAALIPMYLVPVKLEVK